MLKPALRPQPIDPKAGATEEEIKRYPLIVDPVYRACLEDVISYLKDLIEAKRTRASLKRTPLTKLYDEGELTADFCLRHFAAIFDRRSAMPSNKRALVHDILCDAAGRMAERMTPALKPTMVKVKQSEEPTAEATAPDIDGPQL
jgi:hypothetical protein